MRKKRIAALVLALLLVLGAFPAALADEGPESVNGAAGSEEPAKPGDAVEPEDAAESEDAVEPEDAAGPGEIPEPGQAAAPEAEESAAPPDPEESGVFQNGAFSGPQTIPGEPMTASLGWEEDAYNLLLDAWRQRRTEISVSSLRIPWGDINAFWEIGSNVLNDHPELFYADWYGTAYSSGGFISRQIFKYRNIADIDQAVEDFDAAADEAMAEIEGVSDDVEKALLLHDWLVTRCAYNWTVATVGQGHGESSLVYTAYGPLVDRDAVCAGYTLAYKYLLNRADIGSVYLGSDSMNHAWNGVLIGGRWYHVDATWDDPTPNTEGRCRHHYFLLSDKTMADGNHNHKGWDTLVTCGDQSYESGWAFNGAEHSFHRWNGAYYYIKELDGDWKTRLFRTDRLDSRGEELTADLGLTSHGGAVWRDNMLYLIPTAYNGRDQRVLLACDLDAGLTAQAGLFPYTRGSSPDGYYSESHDRTGLRYNAETLELEVISSTRRQVIASFPARALSGGWNAPPESGFILAPGLSGDGAAALLYGADGTAPENAALWAAFYREGRLTAVRPAAVQARVDRGVSDVVPPLVLAYPDLSDLPRYDSVRLLLLTEEGFLPLSAAA